MKAYYWEFVKIGLRTVMITIETYFFEDDISKGGFLFVIVFLYGFLSYYVKPYSSAQMNTYDILSVIMCLGSFILIVIASGNKTKSYFRYNEVLFYVSIILFIVSNVIYVISIVL